MCQAFEGESNYLYAIEREEREKELKRLKDKEETQEDSKELN